MEKTKSMNRMFLAMLLWAILSPIALGGILSTLSPTMLNIVAELLFSIPVVVYILIKHVKVKEWIPLRILPVSVILMSALAGFLFLPLTTFINLLSMLFATNYVSEASTQMTSNPLWMNLVVVAVIPAVVEELTYRGIVYHAYREKGVIIGTLASGIVFGIMHRNLNQFCYAMILGFIFCIMVEITGSIFASITAHFVINGWNVLLMFIQEPLQKAAGVTAATQSEITLETMAAAIGIYGVMAIISTALAIGVLIWMTKYCKREPHMRWCFRKHELPEGVKRSFLTPSFVIAVVVAFGYMIFLEFI